MRVRYGPARVPSVPVVRAAVRAATAGRVLHSAAVVEAPAAAIAVVSYQTRDLLDACLASLRADAEAGLAEVWVVDNGSTDGSPELVAERHPWARLETPGENLGFGRAVNLVAARTSAPWVAAANADIVLEPGALAALLAAGADPGVGALGPRLILPDGSTQPSVQPFPTLAEALIRTSQAVRVSRRARRAVLLEWDPDVARDVPWATGAFLLVRAAAFAQVGGFDERQWLYAEDMDLCWRLTRAGWRVRYEPSARVHHRVSASTREAFGKGLEQQWMGATYAWMVRRRGLARTWATAGVVFGEATARGAVLSALARRDAARYGRRRDVARAQARSARQGLRSRAKLLSVR